MAFIGTIPTGELTLEDRVPDHDNIIQIHSIHHQTVRHHYELYVELMHRAGPLTRVQHEMIGVVVSAENRCHYSLHHHGAGLRRYLRLAGINESQRNVLVSALGGDYRTGDVDDMGRAMLDYTVKLTREPWSVDVDDVDRLRSGGFADRAIHDICALAAYFAFVNRTADGLGVTLESAD